MGESSRLDRNLRAIVLGLVVSIVALGAFFGWTVYRDRMIAEDASPALRIIRVLKGEVRQRPNDAMLRVRLGEALAAAGREQEAIEQLNAALTIDPKHTGALIDLGQIAMANARYGTAEEYFTQVLDATNGSEFEEVSDRREVALYQLGLIALNAKGYEDAIGYFKAALRIRKDASDTYYYLSLAMDGAGDIDGAIRQLDIALAFDPNFGQAHYYLGQLHMRREEKAIASAHFALAAKADPNAKEPKEALAQFGDPYELMEQARSLRSKDPSAAVEAATIARNVLSDDVEAIMLLGSLLEEAGRKDGALEAYKSAQALAPDDDRVASAVKRLSPAKGDDK